MATPHAEQFGRVWHWFNPDDDEGCWMFFDANDKAVVRVSPGGDVDILADEGDTYWIVTVNDRYWHSLDGCPKGDSR